MARNLISGRPVILAMMARDFPNQTITDHDFEDCAIEGPAVLYLRDSDVSHCVFDVHPASGVDSIIWEGPKKPKALVGVIGAFNCTFKRCHFVGVGFLLAAGDIPEFKRQVAPSSPS